MFNFLRRVVSSLGSFMGSTGGILVGTHILQSSMGADIIQHPVLGVVIKIRQGFDVGFAPWAVAVDQLLMSVPGYDVIRGLFLSEAASVSQYATTYLALVAGVGVSILASLMTSGQSWIKDLVESSKTVPSRSSNSQIGGSTKAAKDTQITSKEPRQKSRKTTGIVRNNPWGK